MKTVGKKEFATIIQGGDIEPLSSQELTFNNYELDIYLTYNLLTNEFTELNDTNFSEFQLKKIEDKIIAFYDDNREDLPDFWADEEPYQAETVYARLLTN